MERSEYLSEILDVNVIFWKAVKKQIAASKTEQTLKKKKKRLTHLHKTHEHAHLVSIPCS